MARARRQGLSGDPPRGWDGHRTTYISGDSAPLDEAAKKALAETVNALKPWFRA